MRLLLVLCLPALSLGRRHHRGHRRHPGGDQVTQPTVPKPLADEDIPNKIDLSYQVPKKAGMAEGDMDLGKDADVGLYLDSLAGDEGEAESAPSKYYNAIQSTSRRKWQPGPSGLIEIPYQIRGYDSQDRGRLERAMRSLEAGTGGNCLKFVPRSGQRDYLTVVSRYGEGCSSPVGRYVGENEINLESSSDGSCMDQPTIQHEFLHTLGLYHEHSRFDRDNYLTILPQNIQSGLQDQFDKVTQREATTYGTSYDFTSVMHYKKDAFGRRSGRRSRLNTMLPKTGFTQFTNVMGRAAAPSQIDYAKIKAIYGCPLRNTGGVVNPVNPVVPVVPVPTQPPIVPISQNCFDSSTRCSRYSFLCQSFSFMRTLCRQTCGQCAPSGFSFNNGFGFNAGTNGGTGYGGGYGPNPTFG